MRSSLKLRKAQNLERMLSEINQLRTNPEKIVQMLNKRKENFSKQDQLLYFSPHHPKRAIKTKQGIRPINMLIGELYSQDPLPSFTQNQQLTIFAQQLAYSLKNKQIHQVFLTTEMANYVRNGLKQSETYTFNQKVHCLIAVGFDQQFEPLMSLLIDDGDQRKQNRNILLTKNLKYVGRGVANLQLHPELIVGVYLLTSNIQLKEN